MGSRTHLGVPDLSDAQLHQLAVLLEEAVFRSWQAPSRLYGVFLPPPGRAPWRNPAGDPEPTWWCVAEGDPYDFLDWVRVDESVDALALAVTGWAFPPEAPETWRGRPSQHPQRVRVRSVVVVSPDGRQCSAIRRRDTGEVAVDANGEGPMMRALLAVWGHEPGGRAA
jgi:hypothetical protein